MPCLAALQCIGTSNQVRDIGPVAAADPHLQSLELSDFSFPMNIAPIGTCSHLLSLKISSTNIFHDDRGIDNLLPLSSCKLLTDVDLSGCSSSLSDLSLLAPCVHIKSLRLSDSTSVSNLSPMSSLVELTSLRLRSDLLQNLDALAACAQLADLSLAMFNINPSLGPLASCQLLRLVCISFASYNGADFLPLAKCSLLAELNLRYCRQLTDICELQKLPRLRALELVRCRALADISPLSTCAMLQRLAIDGSHWSLIPSAS